MNLSLTNVAKAVAVGGIASVAALVTDNKDFSFTGGKWEHVAEAFVGGAASTFLLLFKTKSELSPPEVKK